MGKKLLTADQPSRPLNDKQILATTKYRVKRRAPLTLPGRKASLLLAACLLFLLIVLTGCGRAQATLTPYSPEATKISDLFWFVTAIAAAVFLIVEGLLFFAVIRFRDRPNAGEPLQVHGNLRVEIAWTLLPAIILAGVFVMTAITMSDLAAIPSSRMQVKIIGHQWWWELQYPGMAITTATDLHVPVGERVNVEVESGDVIHSFWAPELGGKIDAIPGRTNKTGFKPDRIDVFLGRCAEFCGTQHANMGFMVISDSPDDFANWVKEQQTPPGTPTGKELQGQQVFLSSACITCHTIEGTRAQAKVGPDLTHFASRRSIAAMTLDNTPENLAKWLSNPQAVKPGNVMPNLNLSRENVDLLVAYLGSLR